MITKRLQDTIRHYRLCRNYWKTRYVKEGNQFFLHRSIFYTDLMREEIQALNRAMGKVVMEVTQ